MELRRLLMYFLQPFSPSIWLASSYNNYAVSSNQLLTNLLNIIDGTLVQQ